MLIQIQTSIIRHYHAELGLTYCIEKNNNFLNRKKQISNQLNFNSDVPLDTMQKDLSINKILIDIIIVIYIFSS